MFWSLTNTYWLKAHEIFIRDIPSECTFTIAGNANPVAMNHLLLGKKPLVGSRPRRGPPPGSVPPR